MRNLRYALLLLAGLLVGACGFHLRGDTPLAFSSLYLEGPAGSTVTAQLQRVLGARAAPKLAAAREQGEVMLQIIGDTREKIILSLAADGKVREFQLRHRVQFRIAQVAREDAKGPEEIVITRVVSHNDTQILAKEQEAELLYREMQNDAVEQILRRLAAVRLA